MSRVLPKKSEKNRAKQRFFWPAAPFCPPSGTSAPAGRLFAAGFSRPPRIRARQDRSFSPARVLVQADLAGRARGIPCREADAPHKPVRKDGLFSRFFSTVSANHNILYDFFLEITGYYTFYTIFDVKLFQLARTFLLLIFVRFVIIKS